MKIIAYMSTYGAQENTIIGGLLNVTYPERPYWIKLNFGNYWRGLIPSADNETMTFYVANELTLYTFILNDIVGGYGHPYGKLYFKKWIGPNLVTINSDYWSVDSTCSAYLLFGEKYQIYMMGVDLPIRCIGDIVMTAETSRIIQTTRIDTELSPLYHYISWNAWRESINTIRAEYQDNLDNTLEASVSIYDKNGNLLTRFQPDNEWFTITWNGAIENESYNVALNISHRNYGSFTINTPIGPTVEPIPGIGNPFSLPAGLTLAGIGSLILIFVIGLSFDALRVQLGVLGIAMTVLLCWYMKLLPLPGPGGGLYTAILILFVAVLFAITWRRYR